MTTLIVEDEASMRALLTRLLELRGYPTRACADAEEALATFADQPFDLVILDRFLPGMDGLELCKALRKLPGGQWSIILVFTSAQRPEDLQAALAAGADDYMTKPLDHTIFDIRLTITESLSHHRHQRRLAEQERDAALSRLESSRDDMRSILNRLRIGTAITDPAGRITFLSEAAQRLFDTPADASLGQPWEAVFPLREEEIRDLRAQVSNAPAERTRVPAHVTTADERHFWMEIDVQDDPRDARRNIFALYDVTQIEEIRRKLDGAPFQEIIGNSPPMQTVFHMIRELARVDATVLLEGETGTGKELVARAIHRSSPRASGPFVAVNCAGLPESLVASLLFGHRRGAFTGAVEDHKGVFESADGGTIFLDEIGDIPPSVQTALLRVLQEREITRLGDTVTRKIDVRVLAATHHDLGALVESGRFRMDLLYRIRVARIYIPPLRERRQDVSMLAAHFLDELAASVRKSGRELAPQTLQLLMNYRWPGNVRELRGAIEYALISSESPVIKPEDLPPEILQGVQKSVRLFSDPADQRARILEALERAGGNRSRAADLLGISRATFYRRLGKLGIRTRP